jgi:hypothetical protein
MGSSQTARTIGAEEAFTGINPKRRSIPYAIGVPALEFPDGIQFLNGQSH